MKFPREFYVPKNAEKHEDTALSAVWYTAEIGGKFWLTAFGGKRSKPDLYCTYRTEGERNHSIQNWLGGLKARQERKAQAKANRTGLQEPAHSAKILKGYLQEFFPGVKFSVTSETYSGGDSIHVEYTDGPLYEEVSRIADLFQHGHFDGMTDMYNYTPVRVGCHGAKYVQVYRSHSPEYRDALLPILQERYACRWGNGEELGNYELRQVTQAEMILRGITQEEIERLTQERIDTIAAMATLAY